MELSPPADERILLAALGRFAADGLSAQRRSVAEDAGGSAGRIIHHCGSRERDRLDLAESPIWLRTHHESLVLPMLELCTAPLPTDSSLPDAHRAAAPGDAAASSEEGTTP